MRHQDLTANHILESWSYTNAANRTGATGFVPGDVGRIAFQQDNSSYWRLIDDSPVLWVALQNNIVESYTYATAALRIAASGFVPGDVGKLAYQTDAGTYWRLTATTPQWMLVAPNDPETWVYATATDRNTATGFIANDTGRLAFQTDTGQYWRLVSQSAGVPTWAIASPLESFTYANAAARIAATGMKTWDVGRIAYQTDTGAYWRVLSQSAGVPTWQGMSVGTDPINSNISTQTGFAADTYLAGSACTVSTGDFRARTQYRCMFDMVKTAAGVATPIVAVRIGTGSIGDNAIMQFTFGAGTAAADGGMFEVLVNFRTVGSGTSAITTGICRCTHLLSTTGLINNGQLYIVNATSAGFNSTTQTAIGISFNGGTAFSGTVTTVIAQLDQP